MGHICKECGETITGAVQETRELATLRAELDRVKGVALHLAGEEDDFQRLRAERDELGERWEALRTRVATRRVACGESGNFIEASELELVLTLIESLEPDESEE